MSASGKRRNGIATWCLLGTAVALLLAIFVLLRLSVATDYFYHALIKDPQRTSPAGSVIVAPADGTVLYVRRIEDGMIPEVVKRGVPVPVIEHLKTEPLRPFGDGYLIGIYMNTFGVHVNRVPDHGTIEQRFIYNGPHMDMTRAETKIILNSMIPGWTSLRRILGLHPFGIEDDADFVLQSARETLVLRSESGNYLYIVRIADYYVGKILTWVAEGATVRRGDKLGMISWGSQTDLFIEDSEGLRIEASVGAYVYGGETILARY